MMKFSIIIPFKAENEYLRECLSYCKLLEYPLFEIILLPDLDCTINLPNVKIVPTGNVGPAKKRDIGSNVASGDILAFIDDDAYPCKDWLSNAIGYFNDEIVAVGGPAMTPKSDSILKRASGAVYASLIGGGGMTYRYIPGEEREVDDYPSCNFLIHRDVMKEAGGFDTHYYPGEDTKLCHDIVTVLKKKILYAPDVKVYHHRRPLFRPHLKQIWQYSLHRGFFVKKFPATSFRLTYFIPSFFSLAFFIGIIFILAGGIFSLLAIIGYLIYLVAIIISGIVAGLKERSLLMTLLVPCGIFFTHITYGIGFIVGIMNKELAQ